MHLARMGVFYGSIIEVSLSSMALVQCLCLVVSHVEVLQPPHARNLPWSTLFSGVTCSQRCFADFHHRVL